MTRVGGQHELPPPQAQQVVFPQNALHLLGIDDPAAAPQLGGAARPSVAGELQGDALDGVAQFQVRIGSLLVRLPAVEAGTRQLRQLTHPLDAHRRRLLDLLPDLLADSGFQSRPAVSAVVRCAASTVLKNRSPWSGGRPCALAPPCAFLPSGASLRRERRCRDLGETIAASGAAGWD